MDMVWRVALAYMFVLFGLRMLGKREFSQMSPSELVALLMIPELLSQALVRDDFSMTNALVGVCTIFLLVFASSAITHVSERAAQAVQSSPTVLISRGCWVPDHLNMERVSTDEVYTEMRKSGLERIDQVRWAMLETDGRISIVPEPPMSSPIGSTAGIRSSDATDVGPA